MAESESPVTSVPDAHDFVRWDVLQQLGERLEKLSGMVEELADQLAPEKLTMIDAPEEAKLIRRYFESLDQIGWHSEAQAKAAGLNGESK